MDGELPQYRPANRHDDGKWGTANGQLRNGRRTTMEDGDVVAGEVVEAAMEADDFWERLFWIYNGA